MTTTTPCYYCSAMASEYEVTNGTGRYVMPYQNIYVGTLVALSIAIVIGNILVLITFGK